MSDDAIDERQGATEAAVLRLEDVRKTYVMGSETVYALAGMTPASEFLSAFTITMKRIVASPLLFDRRTAPDTAPGHVRPVYLHVEQRTAGSTPG